MPVDTPERMAPVVGREGRRSLLLEAARGVFVARGYHAAAMDEIAEAAGVSKPVLYQHFPSKLELYLALLDEGCATLLTTIEAALASTHDNGTRVQRTFEAYFTFISADDATYRLVFESDLGHEKEVAARVERMNESAAARVAEVIAADTGLSPADAHLLGWGLTGAAQTAARRWLREGAGIPSGEAVRLMSALAWRGISGFPLSHPPAHSQP